MFMPSSYGWENLRATDFPTSNFNRQDAKNAKIEYKGFFPDALTLEFAFQGQS
jgi:hypothetical protein